MGINFLIFVFIHRFFDADQLQFRPRLQPSPTAPTAAATTVLPAHISELLYFADSVPATATEPTAAYPKAATATAATTAGRRPQPQRPTNGRAVTTHGRAGSRPKWPR